MFDADRPITSIHQDKLNRAIFSKYLARCLLDHHDPESLVVGLYGGWGAGKTSVLNLVRDELNAASINLLDEEKPIILNFSPWSYSGQNQIIYNFFRRLAATLRTATQLKQADRIVYLLELYVSFFTHQTVPSAFKPKSAWYKNIFRKTQERDFGWESGRDPTEVKAELNTLLQAQSCKIIILIDNISRLYSDEIRQIFQIIKSMGDYTNTTYLIAMDKEQVIQTLNESESTNAEALLEKIVQLPFVIPPILTQDLEAIFADRLKDVMLQVPLDAWSTEYWADIYYHSIKFYFNNCRDITRYVNTLQFSYPRLRDVVNPVDFFALSAIEVFATEVYYGIRDNKDLFTDLFDHVYVMDKGQIERDKSRCEEILARSKNVPKEILLESIIRLFPRIRHVYCPGIPFFHSDATARKLKRICSPDLFDAYFRLSMQSSQLSRTEFDNLISLAEDKSAFDHALARLNQDDKIIKFLDALDSNVLQTIPLNHIPTIIHALVDDGDLFPPGQNNLLSLDTPMRIYRIVHQLLQRLPHSDDRFNILQEAFAHATKSIYTSVYLLKGEVREHVEESDTFLPLEFRDITPQQIKSLQQLTVSRIESWAKHGNLIDHPRLIALLEAWRAWGKEENLQNYLTTITQTDRGLVGFLTAALSKAIHEAMFQYEKKADWQQSLDTINSFIPAEKLEAHAKLLFEDEYFEKLREQEQLALMIFLDLMKSQTTKIIPKTTA